MQLTGSSEGCAARPHSAGRTQGAQPEQHKGWALKGRRQGQIPKNASAGGRGQHSVGCCRSCASHRTRPQALESFRQAGLSCSHQFSGLVGFSCCPPPTQWQRQQGRRALASPTSGPAAEPAAACQSAAGQGQQQQQWHGRQGGAHQLQRGGAAATATPSLGGEWVSQCGCPEAPSALQSHSAGREGGRAEGGKQIRIHQKDGEGAFWRQGRAMHGSSGGRWPPKHTFYRPLLHCCRACSPAIR